jgi:hypothetical protein
MFPQRMAVIHPEIATCEPAGVFRLLHYASPVGCFVVLGITDLTDNLCMKNNAHHSCHPIFFATSSFYLFHQIRLLLALLGVENCSDRFQCSMKHL